MISEIRDKVYRLIAENKHQEVLRNGNHRSAGVYMLYVDNFESDTIIPFYIGQTNNFQDRHKQHLSELMALNRLQHNCYEYAVIKDLYNGRARACKIFSYMVNHHCSFNDWHMIILEEIADDETREKREQEYIDSLYAPFFGFNQLNYVLQGIAYDFGKITKETLLETANADVQNILNFASYGYCSYNWYRVCETLLKLIPTEAPIASNLIQVSQSRKDLEQTKGQLSQMRHFCNWGAEEKAWNLCKRTITDFFSKHKLGSKEMPKLVIKVLLFDREKDREKLNKYFARTKLRDCFQVFEALQQAHGAQLSAIKDELASISGSYANLEEKANQLSLFVLQQLLPVSYTSHPLGSLATGFPIDLESVGDNECHINIEYTCFKEDYNYGFYPEICQITYCIKRNGKKYAREAYIDNSLTDFFDQEDIYYYERGFRAGPFNPFLVGGAGTHIPVAMEYRNGINESSFQNAPAEDLKRILKEISDLIDAQTTVKYSTSGYKSEILRFIETPALKNLLISKLLKKQCK